jgi:Zn-dependent M28 family amino/carboxypeptidase
MLDIDTLFTSDVGWAHLETLTEIGGRLPGTDAERQAAEATADAMEAAGARNVHLDEYDITGWERGRNEISISMADETFRGVALPRSPSTVATGPLVDLSYGLPADFAEADVTDRIVMVAAGVPDGTDRYVHRTEKYGRAVENGAAGFLFRSTLDGDLPMTGSLGTETDPIGDVPAVAVSKERGLRLSRRFEGTPLEVAVTATVEPTTSQNVHAEVGPETDEQILLTSHVDAHDLGTGAVDNGTGTAGVVEILGALADAESTLDTRIHAIAFGCEEINLVGSEHGARELDASRVKAIVNLDGVAQSRELEAHTHGFESLRAVVEMISERFDHPIATSDRAVPFSDHWPFLKRGVPTCFVTASADAALRGWGHTHGDTLDKVEPRDLREQAILLTALVRRLADEAVETIHESAETIATRLEDEGKAEGLQAMGWWPYDDE